MVASARRLADIFNGDHGPGQQKPGTGYSKSGSLYPDVKLLQWRGSAFPKLGKRPAAIFSQCKKSVVLHGIVPRP